MCGYVSKCDEDQTMSADILFSNRISGCEPPSNMECCHQSEAVLILGYAELICGVASVTQDHKKQQLMRYKYLSGRGTKALKVAYCTSSRCVALSVRTQTQDPIWWEIHLLYFFEDKLHFHCLKHFKISCITMIQEINDGLRITIIDPSILFSIIHVVYCISDNRGHFVFELTAKNLKSSNLIIWKKEQHIQMQHAQSLFAWRNDLINNQNTFLSINSLIHKPIVLALDEYQLKQLWPPVKYNKHDSSGFCM